MTPLLVGPDPLGPVFKGPASGAQVLGILPDRTTQDRPGSFARLLPLDVLAVPGVVVLGSV